MLRSFSPVVKKIQDDTEYMTFKMKEKDIHGFSTFLPPFFAGLIFFLFVLMYFERAMITFICNFSLAAFLGLILAVVLFFLLSSQLIICNVSNLQKFQENQKKRAEERKIKKEAEKVRKAEEKARKAEEKAKKAEEKKQENLRKAEEKKKKDEEKKALKEAEKAKKAEEKAKKAEEKKA